jgi:hypothetical protein
MARRTTLLDQAFTLALGRAPRAVQFGDLVWNLDNLHGCRCLRPRNAPCGYHRAAPREGGKGAPGSLMKRDFWTSWTCE